LLQAVVALVRGPRASHTTILDLWIHPAKSLEAGIF
jgi:hypothetical protein